MIISIYLIVFLLCCYFLYRDYRVFLFWISLIDKIFESDDWRELIEQFNAVSYHSMVFSFKPLRMECWFSEDFCCGLM